jgi:hypothetical protein
VSRVAKGSAKVDLDGGTAELHVRDVCVFDAFAVSNSLDPTHPLGNVVSAVIESLDMQWSGVTRSLIGFSDPVNQFSGELLRVLGNDKGDSENSEDHRTRIQVCLLGDYESQLCPVWTRSQWGVLLTD